MTSPTGINTNSHLNDDDDEMLVTKRNGNTEIISFNKILTRIKKIGNEVNIKINYTNLAMKVIDQLFNCITTTQIDNLTCEQCASMSSIRPEYNILASRIAISNHHKNTSSDFFKVVHQLFHQYDSFNEHHPIVTKQLYDIAYKYNTQFNDAIDYDRDYLIDYFGFKTLERAYLMKANGVILERPQHMWLRVSIGIHGDDLPAILESYNLLSQKYFTHGTPTLFNAGTNRPQLSSCFLIGMSDDSIKGIYDTLTDCALISKWAGGIGLHIHNVRASGSHIRGTNGTSNGIVPMLRVFNNTAKYVDQCVLPDTIIYTNDSGPIQIQHCQANSTQIFNKNGDYELIQNVLEHHYNGDLFHIHTMHSIFPLSITPEHPILAIQNQKKGINYKTIANRLDKNLASIDWIDAKDINTDTLIAFSIPSSFTDIPSISPDDCRAYGIILGDGCINNKIDSSGYVSMHTIHKSNTLEFLKNYFDSFCIQYYISHDNNTTRFRWNQNNALPFRYNDFYDSNKSKRILPKWLNLPIHKSKFIIKGLIETDGCVNKELTFDSTSLNLIESMRFLFLKMGILTSGYIRDRIGEVHLTHKGHIENKLLSYCLRIPKTHDVCDLLDIQFSNNQFFKFFKYNDLLFTRVKDIQVSNYNGILYDLQLNTEHNYLIHNGLIHNGGGKRNGSFAIYLEPWHADIELFLQMRKNHGDEELKARDLFYALWIPDLFMKRVKEDKQWTLMCPDECPLLSDKYGSDFDQLYESYENNNKGKKQISARKLWFDILDSQMETGTPYLLYKDSVNNKSNQKNIGTIKSSNLCTEITEYSDSNETAVCNLASIALPAFVENSTFNYSKLHEITKVVTNNLNKIIDVNFYPTDKAKLSNHKHRPIGIGVQGLADVFMLLNIPFHSDEAKNINKLIFETIYHAALEKSCELSANFEPYSTFKGSPASQGILQFDMWDVTPSNRYDWHLLKQKIITYGLRNSLLLAPMPTASTSQILGYNECFEPITSNIYNRRTNAGEFIVANKYMMKDLIDLNLWNEDLKNNIIANQGSIQHIDAIPQNIKDKYKTVWEIPMKHIIDMAADRGAFICQSQSLNLWIEDPNYNNLTSMHFYGWSKGLKTGIYYLRRRAVHQAQQFTIEPTQIANNNSNNDEPCEMCSS